MVWRLRGGEGCRASGKPSPNSPPCLPQLCWSCLAVWDRLWKQLLQCSEPLGKASAQRQSSVNAPGRQQLIPQAASSDFTRTHLFCSSSLGIFPLNIFRGPLLHFFQPLCTECNPQICGQLSHPGCPSASYRSSSRC